GGRRGGRRGAGAGRRGPAPTARATADETPAPMPLLVVCRTIITQGNASEAPASALVPMRPRKNPSKVITPANARSVRMFGAARRSRVGRIGPSSSSLVRAAPGLEAVVLAGGRENAGSGVATERSAMGAPPVRGWSSAWDRTSSKDRAAALRARRFAV